MPGPEHNVFSKYGVVFILSAVAGVGFSTLVFGPMLGRALARNVNDSLEAMAVGGTLGTLVGFFGAIALAWYVGSRRVS